MEIYSPFSVSIGRALWVIAIVRMLDLALSGSDYTRSPGCSSPQTPGKPTCGRNWRGPPSAVSLISRTHIFPMASWSVTRTQFPGSRRG